MESIRIILTIILGVDAILLVAIVLLQDDQGEGIGGIFGGGSNTAFGSRAGNVLTRATTLLATIFLVCTFAVAWVSRGEVLGDVRAKALQQSQGTTGEKNWYEPTTNTGSTGGATGGTAGDGAPAVDTPAGQ